MANVVISVYLDTNIHYLKQHYAAIRDRQALLLFYDQNI